MSHPFADLVEDRVLLNDVTLTFEVVIATSFEARPHFLQLARRSAIGDRFKVLERVFRELRGDKKWSWHRIKDYLLPCLLTHLDGGDWHTVVSENDAGSMWAPPAVPAA